MATYERNQSLTKSSSSGLPALPSMDIGSVIIRSLQNALEGTSEDDLPSKITEGINNSDIVKINGNKGGVSKNKNSSPIDNLLSGGEKAAKEYYSDKKKKDDVVRKKEEQDRIKRDQQIEKNVESAMKGLSTFTQNPLKGLDDALKGGMVKLAKGFDKFWNFPLFKEDKDKKDDEKNKKNKKDEGNDKKDEAKLAPIIKGAIETSKLGDDSKVASLIKDGVEASKFADESKMANVIKTGINASKLIGENNRDKIPQSKQKEDEKKTKEANVEKKRDKQHEEQSEKSTITNLILTKIFGTIGGVLTTIAALAVLIPIIVGHLAGLIVSIKDFFTVGLPANIVKLKLGVQKSLFEFADAIGLTKFFAVKLTDDEKNELKTLEKELKKQDAYKTYNKYADKEGNLKSTSETNRRIAEERQAQLDEQIAKGLISENDAVNAKEAINVYLDRAKDAERKLKLLEDAKKTLSESGSGKRYLELVEKRDNGAKGKIAELETEINNADIAVLQKRMDEGKLTKGQYERYGLEGKIQMTSPFAKQWVSEGLQERGMAVEHAVTDTAKTLYHDVFVSTSDGYNPAADRVVNNNYTNVTVEAPAAAGI